jgi:M penetrans paralogue family 26
MENKRLPNATLTIIFGLLSIMTCFLFGIVGLIFGIVTLVVSKKDLALLKENPKLYSNGSTIIMGRVLAVIGITISTIYLGFIIFVYTVVGIENVDAWQQNLLDRAKYEQENR